MPFQNSRRRYASPCVGLGSHDRAVEQLTRPQKKICAARICDEGLSFHFSGHLFDQYFARFNKSVGALERFKEFAKENIDLGIESCDAIGEIRCGVRHGYLTGRWEVQDKVVQLTTFVDHGLLFPDQIEQMERLDQQRFENAHPGRRRTPGYKHPWLKDTRGAARR